MVTSPNEERFSFHCEWHDEKAELVRRYVMTFFPADGAVEIQDCKSKRPFLKRTKINALTLDHFFIGGCVSIFSRQMKIMDYADPHTKRSLASLKESTFVMIKPDAYQRMGKIMQAIKDLGMVFTRVQMAKLNKSQARDFAPGASDEEIEFLCSDVVVGCEVVGDGAVDKMVNNCHSIRAQYGSDDMKNAVHVSGDKEAAVRDVSYFFSKLNPPSTALFNNCTLCIIRPHAMKQCGDIIDDILKNNFEISAMEQFTLNSVEAKKFLEVYHQVLPEYNDMCQEMCSGPCMVMEIRQENAVNAFRELIVGPHDPEIAKHLRPNTLRAKYGINRVQNVLHCTDLPEDGQLEVEYFFRVLKGQQS